MVQSLVSVEKVDVWVSRVDGTDSGGCGKSEHAPCKTIATGISRAPWNGVISVDGRNTEKNPYDCSVGGRPTGILIDKQLTIVSKRSQAYVHCTNGTNWVIDCRGSLPQQKGMTVVLLGLSFIEAALQFIESSVDIENCNFLNSTTKTSITIEVTTLYKFFLYIRNTVFKTNNGCIEAYINSSVPLSTPLRDPLVTLKDVTFANSIASSSLVGFVIQGKLSSDNLLTFQGVTLQQNQANRGIYVTTLQTNTVIKMDVYDATFKDNIWEKAGLDIFSNGTKMFEAHVSYSRFTNEAGTGSVTGPGSCIRFRTTNCRSSFVVTNSKFENNVLKENLQKEPKQRGCIHVENDGNSLTRLFNVLARNGTSSALLLRFKNAKNSLNIERSKFYNHRSFFGGALSVDALVCVFRNGSELCTYDKAKQHGLNASILYSTFIGNAVDRKGGAISIVPEHAFQGKIDVKHCNFENNFANDMGGHLYIGGGEATLNVEDTRFSQTLHRIENYEHKNMLFFSNLGSFNVRNTMFDSNTTEMNIDPLLRISRAQSFLIDNQSSVLCPYGSKLKILNSTYVKWGNDADNDYTDELNHLYRFSCEQCPWYMYSLQRGRTLGLDIKNFSCFPCPNGADCGRNIAAKSGFWGYKVQHDPPLLKFARCPSGYCCKASEETHPIEYNTCCGNRNGTLCGKCKNGFVESLVSRNCQPAKELDGVLFFAELVVSSAFVTLFFLSIPILSYFSKVCSCCCEKESNNVNVCNCVCGRECKCSCRCPKECKCRTRVSVLTYLFMTLFFFQALSRLIEIQELKAIFNSSSIPFFFRNFYRFLIGAINFEIASQPFNLFSIFPGIDGVLSKLSIPAIIFSLVITFLIVIHVFILVIGILLGMIIKHSEIKIIQYTMPRVIPLSILPLCEWAFKILSPSYSLAKYRFYYDGNFFSFSLKSPGLLVLQIISLSLLVIIIQVIAVYKIRIRFKKEEEEMTDEETWPKTLYVTVKHLFEQDIEAIRFIPKVALAAISAFAAAPLLKSTLYTVVCVFGFQHQCAFQPYASKCANRLNTTFWFLLLILSFCSIRCSDTVENADDSDLICIRNFIIKAVVFLAILAVLLIFPIGVCLIRRFCKKGLCQLCKKDASADADNSDNKNL